MFCVPCIAFAHVSIPWGILMESTSRSACFVCGLDLVNLSTRKGSVLCRKSSNKDPVWLCGETEMGHNTISSFRMFLMISSPVKVV